MPNELILYTMRLSKAQAKDVEDWRRKQPKIPPMTVALRTLVERGLAADNNENMEAA
jgi:hypothetical protein